MRATFIFEYSSLFAQFLRRAISVFQLTWMFLLDMYRFIFSKKAISCLEKKFLYKGSARHSPPASSAKQPLPVAAPFRLRATLRRRCRHIPSPPLVFARPRKVLSSFFGARKVLPADLVQWCEFFFSFLLFCRAFLVRERCFLLICCSGAECELFFSDLISSWNRAVNLCDADLPLPPAGATLASAPPTSVSASPSLLCQASHRWELSSPPFPCV
ncbi:hypothetical protein KSP40_PGU022499 [Platanthera guangdongensis]|uniref:Transmembrane protein n=1 Tax=Platanthera guangdongensis TaxID=2320717 RepID=A0ABR2LGS4_9ASPA